MTVGKLDLAALEAKDAFIHRHIGPSVSDIAEMLELLGLDSLDALMDQAVPESIRAEFPDSLPGARSEQDVLAELADLAARNKLATSMIGMGYYDTYTPPVILRKSRLVYRLHALPAGNQPGPPRGSACLSDHGNGSHRHGVRQRLFAR